MILMGDGRANLNKIIVNKEKKKKKKYLIARKCATNNGREKLEELVFSYLSSLLSSLSSLPLSYRVSYWRLLNR
jgi:hypothetical protein